MPLTYYVALPFVRTEDGIAAGQAQECQSAPEANRNAEAMSRNPLNVGALAFMRTGDPSLEPIREVWIHDEAFVASRLSIIRIMARRTKAVTVAA
jgi:hypothetical protein